MPKQRLTFTRTETITYEFDYPVDTITRSNAEFWANYGYCGMSPIGQPAAEKPLSGSRTEWKVSKSEPPLGPSPLVTKPTTKKRR